MSGRKSPKSATKRREDAASEEATRNREMQTPKHGSPTRRGVVSPRDEKGVLYRGDFPNPLGDRNRGCF